jgi:hypothetical protein
MKLHYMFFWAVGSIGKQMYLIYSVPNFNAINIANIIIFM